MARQGNTCGAITGSLMAIGLARGRRTRTEPREPAYEPGAELLRRFLAAFGTLHCRELTGCDLSTPEGYAHFEQTHQNDRCVLYLELAARTVVDLLSDQTET